MEEDLSRRASAEQQATSPYLGLERVEPDADSWRTTNKGNLRKVSYRLSPNSWYHFGLLFACALLMLIGQTCVNLERLCQEPID